MNSKIDSPEAIVHRVVKSGDSRVSVWQAEGQHRTRRVLMLAGLLETPKMLHAAGVRFAQSGFTVYSPKHPRRRHGALADPVGLRVADAMGVMNDVDGESRTSQGWIIMGHSLGGVAATIVAGHSLGLYEGDSSSNQHDVAQLVQVTAAGKVNDHSLARDILHPSMLPRAFHEEAELAGEPTKAAGFIGRATLTFLADPPLALRETVAAFGADVRAQTNELQDKGLAVTTIFGHHDIFFSVPKELRKGQEVIDTGHLPTSFDRGSQLVVDITLS